MPTQPHHPGRYPHDPAYHARHRGHQPCSAAEAGQTLVLMSLLLAFLLIPLGLTVAAVNAQREAITQLRALAQDTAHGAALQLDAGSLAEGNARLDASRVDAYVRSALRAGFDAFGPRIDAAAAAAAATVTVLNATRDQPLADPDGGAVYHYPTVCVSADVPVGVVLHNGMAFTHHVHACAQVATP